jgi:hypothetical protein
MACLRCPERARAIRQVPGSCGDANPLGKLMVKAEGSVRIDGRAAFEAAEGDER